MLNVGTHKLINKKTREILGFTFGPIRLITCAVTNKIIKGLCVLGHGLNLIFGSV